MNRQHATLQRTPCSRSGGFTLVEVLVALAIVAVGLAALATTANQTAMTSGYLREKTLAQWIALNRITETRLSGAPPADEQSEGEIEYAGTTWRWELEKIPTPVEGIVRLEARVALETAKEGTWAGTATGFMGSAVAPPGTPPPLWPGNPSAAGGPRTGGPEQPGEVVPPPQAPTPPPGDNPEEPVNPEQ
jgi:general secretion pathway protein I